LIKYCDKVLAGTTPHLLFAIYLPECVSLNISTPKASKPLPTPIQNLA
jgi:hypothetical protein